jgi:hypothetical protein
MTLKRSKRKAENREREDFGGAGHPKTDGPTRLLGGHWVGPKNPSADEGNWRKFVYIITLSAY